MSNVNTDGLPPEMQARIAEIIAKAQASQPQEQPAAPTSFIGSMKQAHEQQVQQAPIQRPPTLMDHTVALRQEVAALRNELHAVAQVTDAVGQAVGQLYQTFLGQSETTDQSGYYQTEAPDEVADY